MTSEATQAAALTAVVVVCFLGLHRLPYRVRIGLDIVSFGAASLFLFSHRAFPFFPPLVGGATSPAVWLRAVGGAWWLLGARLLVASLRFVVQTSKRSKQAHLVSDLSAAGIYIISAAIVLNSVFALPVTGVVATSGVVAVVLGLALQSTLADVFAGIAVGIEAPFGVGDRVQIGDKIEGTVVEANWRSVHIQTDSDDVAIIPNSLVAKADVINQSIPSPHRIVAVEISCPEHAVPERVIAALLEATLLCPDIFRAPPPQAMVARLGSQRNVYKVSFVVANSGQVGSTKDLFLRTARRQLRYLGLHGEILQGGVGPGEYHAIIRLLRDLVLFESLDSEQIEVLARHIQLRRLKPGDPLFAQDAEDGLMYVVRAGVIEITRKINDCSEVIGCIGAGEYIGEISLLTGVPHAATATARTNADVYSLPRTALAPLLSADAALASAFDRSIRRGLEVLHREVAVRATPPIGMREQILLRIRRVFGLPDSEG